MLLLLSDNRLPEMGTTEVEWGLFRKGGAEGEMSGACIV